MIARIHSHKEQPFLLLHASSAKQSAAALLILAVILAVFRYRVFLLGADHFLGGAAGDAGLYTWLFQTVPNDLFSLPWFTTRAFYPYGGSLAWSDNFILPSFIGSPFVQSGLPLPAVYNGILLIATLLSGFFTYRLAFDLCGKFLPSVAAGILFMLDPFVASHLGHPQLQFTFWIPLTALLYFRSVQSPSFRRALVIGLCLAGAFLCSVYYAVFSGLLFLTLLGSMLLLKPGHLRKVQFLTLGAGLAAGLLPLIPFLRPYLLFGEIAGPRAEHEAYFFSAAALSYLSGPPLSFLYSFTGKWSHPEASLFPGIVPYLLSGFALTRLFQLKRDSDVHAALFLSTLVAALPTVPMFSFPGWQYASAVGLWGMCLSFAALLRCLGNAERALGCPYFTNRNIIACFGTVALISFVISFGPLGYPEAGILGLSPFSVLYQFLPGMNAVRAIGRVGVLFHFALAVLSAMSLARLGNRRLALLLLGVFALAECVLVDYPLEPLPEAPPVVKELIERSKPNEASIILPMATAIDRAGLVVHWSEYAHRNTGYMNWLASSNCFTVNGYSGFRSKIMRYLPGRTISFPDRRSLEALREIAGLRYVLYLPSAIPNFNRSEFEHAISQFPGLELLKTDALGNYLFKIDPEVRLHRGLRLLVPSYKSLELPLEIETHERTDRDTTIRVYSSEQDIPIWEYRLPANGSSKDVLPLKKRRNAIAPYVLRFETDAIEQVDISSGPPRPIH